MKTINSINQLFVGQTLLFNDGIENLIIKIIRVDIDKSEIDIECEGVQTWLLISDISKGHVFSQEPEKPKTKRELNIQLHCDRLGAEFSEYHNFIFIQGEAIKGKFSLVIFRPNGYKPTQNYYFRSFANRAEHVANFQNEIDKEIERQKANQTRYDEENDKIQPGSILYASWGYDQTNIDFYQVVSRSGLSVTLQEIGQTKNHDKRGDSGNCVADPEFKKGDPFKKRLSKYGGIKLASYKYCSIWDGKPLSWSSWA